MLKRYLMSVFDSTEEKKDKYGLPYFVFSIQLLFQMRICRKINVLYWMSLKVFAKKLKLHHKSRQMTILKHQFLISHFHPLSAKCTVPRCHKLSPCQRTTLTTTMKDLFFMNGIATITNELHHPQSHCLKKWRHLNWPKSTKKSRLRFHIGMRMLILDSKTFLTMTA